MDVELRPAAATDRYAEMGVFPRAVDPDLRARIRDFYRASDDRLQDGRWVGFFTGDAQVVMGAAEAEGTEEIRQLRDTMWTSVEQRKHWLTEVFLGHTYGDQVEVMLEGMAERADTEGGKYMLSWAGRATWVKASDEDEAMEGIEDEDEGVGASVGEGEGENWKMLFYRVWLMERSELEPLATDD